jgi:D-amino-acid dehydrogenase
MQSTQQLCNDAGIGHLLHRRGHLIIAEHAQSLAKLEAQQALFAQHDIVSRPVSPGDLKARAPELTDRISGGLLIEGTGHVTNPYRLCSGLHESFQAAGGRTTRDELTEIATRSDGGFRLAMRGGTLDASRVIIAAGAWSGEFARQLGSPVPLDTERGYNVTADGWHPSFDVSIASLDRMTIMTPMDIGLRITGFVEFGGLALPPNPQLMHKLQCHLRELFPKSRLPELSNWMGFRPSLPDHLPVIGISPLHRNAIFAFGHQHLGLTLAGVTADIVDDLISGIEPAVDLRPFRADRF